MRHALFELIDTLHEIGVVFAQAYIRFAEQPPRQSTHLPLGTHIGSWANNHVHAFLLCQTAKGSHVVVALKIEHSFLLFVDVPKHIEANGIHAKCFAHLYAVFPIGARYARVVQFGSFHHKGLAVEQKGLVTHREVALLGKGGDR